MLLTAIRHVWERRHMNGLETAIVATPIMLALASVLDIEKVEDFVVDVAFYTGEVINYLLEMPAISDVLAKVA